jgi:hypothetical protein
MHRADRCFLHNIFDRFSVQNALNIEGCLSRDMATCNCADTPEVLSIVQVTVQGPGLSKN